MLTRKFILTIIALTVINAHADKINITATAQDIKKCHVDHRCYLKGSHSIEITNQTNDTHRYEYAYLLCSLKGDWYTDCSIIKNFATVIPHSTWVSNYESHASPRFSIHKSYNYSVQTNIAGYQVSRIENKYSIRVRD